MISLALRSAAARRARTLLTALAVALGVGLISGTYLLTDTIDKAFDSLFADAFANTDVNISPAEREGFDAIGDPLPAALLAKVRAVEGVAKAEGSIFAEGRIFDRDGDNLSAGGAPAFVSSATADPFNAFEYVKGRPPRTAAEAALDSTSAEKGGFDVGDSVRIGGERPARSYRIVGIAKFGSTGSVAGAAVGILTLPEAQRLAGREGRFDGIDVQAAEGVDPERLVFQIRTSVPGEFEVRTGAQAATDQAESITDDLGFIRTILFVFGGVSLFVGAFMIFNAFSMTIAQRTREFAMLRTLGASRRQVLWSVLAESLIVGLLASALGVALGLVLAPALQEVFKAIGAELPDQGTVIKTRTILVAMIVGVSVTVVASLGPALRATRVTPMAALREGAVLPAGHLDRLRVPLSALLGLGGLAAMLIGLFAGGDDAGAVAATLGAGAAAIFLAVAINSSLLVPPIANFLGSGLERIGGVSGRLARENTLRHPGRTAGTAAALMVGVAVVAFVTVFAAGARSSVERSVQDSVRADFVLQSSDGFTPFPIAAAQEIRRLAGVGVVSPIAYAEGLYPGRPDPDFVGGVDPRTLGAAYEFEWEAGSDAAIPALARGGAIVDKGYAESRSLELGERFTLTSATGKRANFTVRGIADTGVVLSDGPNVSIETLVRDFGVRDLQYALVKARPGVDTRRLATQLDARLNRDFPDVQALDREEFIEKISESINQFLTLIYVLLALSVIVSLFGIVNTLALSIHERTRELGMLRAIGTSAPQMRKIVRYESVITAMIGASIGVVLGVLFAILVTRPLASEGFRLAIPVGGLLSLMVLAAVAGVLAAVLPARRAARIDVLRAIAYE